MTGQNEASDPKEYPGQAPHCVVTPRRSIEVGMAGPPQAQPTKLTSWGRRIWLCLLGPSVGVALPEVAQADDVTPGED